MMTTAATKMIAMCKDQMLKCDRMIALHNGRAVIEFMHKVDVESIE